MNTHNVLLWSSCLSRGHQSETRFVAGRGLFIAKAIINSLWPLQSPSYNLYSALDLASHQNRDQIVTAFMIFKIKIAQLVKAMSGQVKRAASAPKKKKRKRRGNQTLSLMTVTR